MDLGAKYEIARVAEFIRSRSFNRVALQVGYLDMIHKMVELITKAGKKSYTLVMGRPNPAKLANFLETALLDSKEFLAPIITPFEAMLALGS
ncbi:hypothetical protein OROGR_020353 [Orobanche gracilis]